MSHINIRSSSRYSTLGPAGIDLLINASRRIDITEHFDDDQVRIKRRLNRRRRKYRLSELPHLKYLNLLDYENKISELRSNPYGFICLSEDTEQQSMESFEHYVRSNIFLLYLRYLKNHMKESIDLQTYSKRVSSAAICLRNCDKFLLHGVAKKAINLYQDCELDRLLPLPVILRNICVSREMILSTTRHLFRACSERFIKEFLEASIQSRFDLWGMWKRNPEVGDAHFCPLSFVCFSEMLETLEVLLDYGFQPTNCREETVQSILREFPTYKKLKALGIDMSSSLYVYEDQWLGEYVFKDQGYRCSVVDEMFYFVSILFEDYREKDFLVQCFKLAWDARKDPFVTREELENAFESHFRNTSSSREVRERRILFMKRLDIYESMVPDDKWKVLQPRRLQHLCRCTIREALNDNWQMPRGVAHLPIPYKMKSYILLKAD